MKLKCVYCLKHFSLGDVFLVLASQYLYLCCMVTHLWHWVDSPRFMDYFRLMSYPSCEKISWSGSSFSGVQVICFTCSQLNFLFRYCHLWGISMTSSCWESLWKDGQTTKWWLGGFLVSSIILIATLLLEGHFHLFILLGWPVFVIWYGTSYDQTLCWVFLSILYSWPFAWLKSVLYTCETC